MSFMGYAGHGPHVAHALATCEAIEWHEAVAPGPRCRALRWTCKCRAPRYFLYTGGGPLFIGRQDGRGWHESTRLPYRQAEELWMRLLTGEAR
ncbi:hypothetical protein IMZ11_26195 [Microtetraspora sp. AC03309]|uniref:hypothetical protein n=1 Tax=Microtetraspora sp. AC03309 TaxID=2779376 RepID=UPI001E499AE8|nr:hypothetical protein [Microtetraspora sp. AC03309]MCC5579122.1 hypothetical protein [Microtetraspora sp. AC03309]